MKKRLIACYASCLSLGQMKHKCPTAQPIAKSWVFDHKLVFAGSPGNAHATLVPEKGKDVPVVIWEVSAEDEVAMDRYHGVQSGYYNKEHMTLEVAGEMADVIIYIMRRCDIGMPSKQYLDIVTKGYLDFNLPMTVLEEALALSYESTIVYETHKEEITHGN